MVIHKNFVSSMVKAKRPKPFISQEVLVLANKGEREKDVDVVSDSTEKYPGDAVSTASSSRMDVEHENRNQPAEPSSSSTVGEPSCPIPNELPKVSLSLSSQVSDASHSSEKDETFRPLPLILRDVTQIPEVHYSHTYSAVDESFHHDQDSFLALIDARLQPLQVDGSAQPSVVALQEHDYTESFSPAMNERGLTESLFPATNERDLTESLFHAANERDLTESLFPASQAPNLTESNFSALEDHTYTMSLFPED
jgi:hypothetical protein